jgi:hypothetical protein
MSGPGSVLLLSRYEATVLFSWAVIIQASTKKKRQGPETVTPAGRLSWPPANHRWRFWTAYFPCRSGAALLIDDE